MYTGFGVEWKNVCYLCQNPVNIKVCPYVPSEKFVECFRVFKELRPIMFIHNLSIYKFFGMKIRRVCMSCYEGQPERVPVRYLMLREITGKQMRVSSGSKTAVELRDWFRAFNDFMNRSDLDDILYDPITPMSSEDLRLFDVWHLYRYQTELSELPQ